MNPLKNNAQRARAVYIIFIVLFVINIVAIISNFMQINLLKTMSAGDINQEAAEANDLRVIVVTIVNLIAVICTVVFFIMWFRRAYYNLHVTGAVNLRYTEGWAAGAWFVPFLNLVRPYQIMDEIWEKTQDATKNLLSHKPVAIVGWWWAVYLISNFAANISIRIFDETSIESLITGTWAQIICCLIEIVSIAITVIMVKQTAEMEAKLYESYEEPQEGEQEDLLGVI